jgi:hypothetical protein
LDLTNKIEDYREELATLNRQARHKEKVKTNHDLAIKLKESEVSIIKRRLAIKEESEIRNTKVIDD